MSFTAIFNLRWQSFPSLPLIPTEPCLSHSTCPADPGMAASSQTFCWDLGCSASCRVSPGALVTSSALCWSAQHCHRLRTAPVQPLHVQSLSVSGLSSILQTGNAWVSTEGDKPPSEPHFWSAFFPPFAVNISCSSPLGWRGGDRGTTWGQQGWHESYDHRPAWSVTLAGVGQPTARYSASLALKIKNNRE